MLLAEVAISFPIQKVQYLSFLWYREKMVSYNYYLLLINQIIYAESKYVLHNTSILHHLNRRENSPKYKFSLKFDTWSSHLQQCHKTPPTGNHVKIHFASGGFVQALQLSCENCHKGANKSELGLSEMDGST